MDGTACSGCHNVNMWHPIEVRHKEDAEVSNLGGGDKSEWVRREEKETRGFSPIFGKGEAWTVKKHNFSFVHVRREAKVSKPIEHFTKAPKGFRQDTLESYIRGEDGTIINVMNGDTEPDFLMTHFCLRYPIRICDSCGLLAASRLLLTHELL